MIGSLSIYGSTRIRQLVANQEISSQSPMYSSAMDLLSMSTFAYTCPPYVLLAARTSHLLDASIANRDLCTAPARSRCKLLGMLTAQAMVMISQLTKLSLQSCNNILWPQAIWRLMKSLPILAPYTLRIWRYRTTLACLAAR